MKKIVSLVLVVLMLVSVFAFASCTKPDDGEKTQGEKTQGTQTQEEIKTPLVVGYSNFSEKFSPFFADTAYDQDVVSMVSLGLLASDRVGSVLLNAGTAAGQTVKYNGKDYTYYSAANCTVEDDLIYTFELRDDIYFSNGEKVTADDVIFSMYVLSDPAYDGSSTFWNLPIKGMAEYRSNMDTKFNLILAAGRDNTTYTYWTEADQTAFWAAFDKAGAAFAQEIADYCIASGYGTTVAEGAAAWGFGGLADDATAADFFAVMFEAYEGDIASLSSTESAGSSFYDLFDNYDAYTIGVSTGESAPSITGIKKINDYKLTVELTEVSAVAIYQLGITITPLSYYGDKAKFDIANNKFGFDKGDLSTVRAKSTVPVGAGPYKFDRYENGVVYFEAFDNYFLGAPKTKYVQFKEGSDNDKLTGVISGTLDVSDPSFSTKVIDAIKEANSNKDLTGNKVTTSLVDNLGYGYLGICADTVKVGDDKSSDASKALRKAFATIFSVYRDLAIDSYYGDRAVVINYPISNTSWAAPQTTDTGYAVAYSKNAQGEALYTANMTAEEKYAAALAGALTWFEAAGYTVENGKVTAAPAGAKLSYEAVIPADGIGDHPAFMILTESKKALESIGITLEINDPANSDVLWDKLDAVTCEFWCAAWGSTVDPDMTQVYHSSNASGSNHYHIADAELDELMAEALKITDQSARKALYAQCLDIILDWGVEVPTYQRKNAVIFSSERVNLDTVATDITPFYGWLSEIDKVELAK